MASDASSYDHVRDSVRGLLITAADQLPAATAGPVDELLDADERSIAVEMLSEMLVESSARISPETIAMCEEVAAEMKLDQSNVQRLRPLVDSGGAR